MTVPILILSILLLLVTTLFVIVLYKYKLLRIHGAIARGPYMTYIYDKNLKVIEIINPKQEIIAEKSKEVENLILQKLTEALKKRSDIFFEYNTIASNAKEMITLCYIEYCNNGTLLCHSLRMDLEKRIEGCNKCNDYVIAIAMNSVSVGVYAKRIGEKEEYIFANDVIKMFCESKEITKSIYWNQQKEDEANLAVIQNNGLFSYEKVLHDCNGIPKKWLNISKALQHIENKGSYIITTVTDITESKQKEVELRETRNNLDMAILAGNMLAWEFDISKKYFRILYGGATLHISDLEELSISVVIKRSIHSTEIIRYRKFIQDILKFGIKNSISIRGIDLEDGTHTYFESVVSPIKDKAGSVVKLLGILRNVSDSENQRINLEKAQKYLALAMEAGGVSVWIYNIAEETFYTLQGDTIAGTGLSMKDNLAMMHPDDAVVCQNLITDMASGKKATCSVIYRFKSNEIEGGYRYYEARKIAVKENGKITYLTGTQKEVTKEHFYQKELEESNTKAKVALTELRLLNKYNRLILDNSNSGFIYLTPDYIVKWENVLTMKSSNKFMQGYKKGCLCHKTLRGLDSPCRNCIMDLAIATKQKIAQEMTNEYGEIVNVLAIPVYSSDKSISGVVLRIDDVTQLRKSYNELQIAKDKAERSDRFKSTFLANMSHEIRTPLNAIIGFSELMADVESKEERHKYSEIIMTNNTLLLKLVSDILDLSRIEAGYINIKNEEFDIAQLYKELDITFTPKMPRDVVFICDITQKPCVVNLDKGRLTQVITNFITNAIKFTKKGYIKIGYELIGDELKLYVTDTGIGIAQENIALVFERFEKLNNFVQGTGLGLSICRSIIEAENGKIGVNSQFGKGSTFWATIPCKEGL